MEARPVRIPRAQARAIRPAVAPEPGARFVENRSGWVRAQRLFLLFASALTGLYLAILAEALLATPGLSSDVVALGILTVAAAGCLLAGASVTITRAPRGIWWTGEEMVVRERFGRPRRYPKASATLVAHRYPAGFLAPGPTEIVEVVPRSGRRMTYLVDEGLLTEPARS